MINRPKLPNLFLLGPAKTATTSTAYYLSQHNDIFVSDPKETLFFEREYENGIEFYLNKYHRHQNGESVVVDGRPMNFVIDYVAERIFEVNPEAKFVVALRHPLKRAYSDWQNWARMRPGRAPKTFEKAISSNIESFRYNKFELEGDYIPFCDSRGGSYIPTYIEASLYGHHLMRFFDLFDRKKFLLLDFDEVVSRPQRAMNKVFQHCEVRQFNLYDVSERNMTPKKHKSVIDIGEIKAQLSKKQIEFLSIIFNYDMNLLSQIKGIDFVKNWEAI